MKQLEKVNELDLNMAVIKKDLDYIKTDVSEIKTTMKDFIKEVRTCYALKSEVDCVKTDVEKLKLEIRAIQLKWATMSGAILIGYLALQILLKHYGLL